MSIITVRIPKEIKRRLEKRRMNVSETVRTLLVRYISELESSDLERRLEALKERLAGRIDAQVVAKLVREDRELR